MLDIVSCESMRKSDLATIEGGVPGVTLMWRAGMGIYESVRWHGRVGIVCGSGNNAGDGYALALILKENNIDATLILLKNKFSADGEYYYKRCQNVSIKTIFYNEDTPLDFDIIVDCILGTGFSGELSPEICEVIEKINSSDAYVVSADINSGLNGDNGLCKIAVKSDITVSIGTRKTGHYLAMAQDYIKKLVNVDIGIEIIEPPYHLIEKADIKKCFKERKHFSNKGTYGYTALIGGCMEYSGAVKLASLALSSLKTGAGVSKLATSRSICPTIMPSLLEVTLYPLDDRNGYIMYNPTQIDGALKGVKAVAIGMGMGEGAQAYEIICHILKKYEMPVIIDADGLNALSRGDINILKETKCTIILTPHPKELERLCGVSVEEILKNPIEIARRFAKEYGVILLLKGASTIVTDGSEVYIINRGCAGMATAGSGDVLSGVLLGICSQNNEPSEQLLNTCAGAFVNGIAGEMAQSELCSVSMTASDTVAKLPMTIKSILENE